MTRTPRPVPTVAMLETRASDGSVIARMTWNPPQSRPMPDSPAWVLRVFPEQDSRISRLGDDAWQRDATYATKAVNDDDAKRVLDYATHVVLAYLERQEEAQTLLESGLDKAVTLAAQETLPLEGGTRG